MNCSFLFTMTSIKPWTTTGALAVLCLCSCTHGSLDLAEPSEPPSSSTPGPSGTPPALTAISPSSAKVGTVITATGSSFGSGAAGSVLTVGGSAASIASWSDSSIVFTVPPGAYPGDRQVVVNTPAGPSGPLPLLIELPPALYVQAHNGITADPGHDYIFGFSIAGNGTLSPIAGSPWSAGDAPQPWTGDAHSLAVDASRRTLYASTYSTLAPFSIDGATGALTLGTPFALGNEGNGSVALSADARRIFVSNCTGEEINVVAISSNGSFSQVAGSPFATGLPTTDCADGAALTPDGGYLYVGTESASFLGFSVGGSGALTPLVGSPFSLQGGVASGNLRLSPDGKVLVVPDNGANKAYLYSIGATGTPTAAGSAGNVTGAYGAAFAPSGDLFYVGSFSGGAVDAFNLSGSTLFSPAATASGVSNAMTVTSDGRFLYLLDSSTQAVEPFEVSAAGSLTSIQASLPIAGTTVTNANQLASILVVP